jgi:hypothetical protein
MRGLAGEVCLVQIHPSVIHLTGYTLEELVGVDRDSTERCYRAGAALLARARRACPPDETGWFGPTVSIYGSGSSCDFTDEGWVKARVATYRKVEKASKRRARLPVQATIAVDLAWDDDWVGSGGPSLAEGEMYATRY